MRKVIILTLVSVFIMIGTELSFAKDITKQVIAHTKLDEEIAKACQNNCEGNRRKGTLTRVTIERIDDHTFKVQTEAHFRNYEHKDPPKIFGQSIGGGVALYDYTIVVAAEGELDDSTCILTITDVDVLNDDEFSRRTDLKSKARREIGKVYEIDNCSRLTNGL